MGYASLYDISYSQPVNYPNWAKLKADRGAVVIRAGQNFFEDALFRYHYANATAAGVPAGIYWFYQPDQPPTLQADAAIRLYKSLDKKPAVIALDVEDISYFDENGTHIYVFPPNPATHSAWLKTWLETVEAGTGVTPMIYTRADYWDKWTTRGTYWAKYPLWVASWTNYSADIRMPADWSNWKFWQYEGGTGRADWITGPVDLNFYNGTITEMYSFFGMQLEGNNVVAMYNNTVAQNKRAWVAEIKPTQKINVAPAELWVDAVILNMGTMAYWDGSHMKTIAEPTFPGRCKLFAAAGVPVIGRFDLDAGALLKEQHTAKEIDGKALKDNWVIGKILDSWHNGAWTWDSVLSGRGDWLPISAIELGMIGTDGYPAGATTPDDWQGRTFQFVVNHLRYLIDNGKVPNIPVIFYTSADWLKKYPGRMAQELTLRAGWLYLHLQSRILSSTATFGNLADIYAYTPPDDYLIPNIPDKYGQRVLLQEFTGGKQNCTQLPGDTMNLSLYQDEAAALFALLKTAPPVVTPPVVTPPATGGTDLAAVTARVEALEAQVTALINWAGSFRK